MDHVQVFNIIRPLYVQKKVNMLILFRTMLLLIYMEWLQKKLLPSALISGTRQSVFSKAKIW